MFKHLNREIILKTLLLILLIVIHLNIKKFGDDLWVESQVLSDCGNVFASAYAFVYNYYITWLPSVIPTYISFILAHYYIGVWKALNIGFCIILVLSLKKVFLFKYDKNSALLCAILFFSLYSFTDQSTAGWLATTPRYLWVAACMIVSVLPIAKTLNHEKVDTSLYCLVILATIYATNTEQGVAVLLPVFCFMSLYVWKYKIKYGIVLLQIFISLINLYYLLSCPGTQKRFADEVATWYPEYVHFSVLERLYIGLSSTVVNRFLSGVNWPYSILLLMIVILLLKKREMTRKKTFLLSGIFFATQFKSFGLFPTLLGCVFPIITNAPMFTGNFPMVNYSTWNTILPYFHVFICITFPFLVILGIYYSFDGRQEKILFVLIFIAGLLSRVMIGLSPTIYASSTRTFIFFDLSVIIIGMSLFMKCVVRFDDKYKLILWSILITISLFHYSDMVMYIREFFSRLH